MRISDWSSDVCSSDLSNDRVSVWIIGWFLECRPQCGRGGRMIPGHRSEYDPFSGFTTFIEVPGRTGAYSLLRYSIQASEPGRRRSDPPVTFEQSSRP